jgi:hypothetical protein
LPAIRATPRQRTTENFATLDLHYSLTSSARLIKRQKTFFEAFL